MTDANCGERFVREIRMRGIKRIVFLLHGERGVISFSIATGWQLYGPADAALYPVQHGVDYHSPVETELGTKVPSCTWLDGKPCWCDGSGMVGEDVFKALAKSEDAMWAELESCYELWLQPEGENKS